MQNNNEIYELYIEAKKQVKRRCKDDENCINYILEKILEKDFRRLYKYDSSRGKINTFLNTVVKNLKIDYIRREKNYPEVELEEENKDLEDIYIEEDTKERLSKTVKDLTLNNKIIDEDVEIFEYIKNGYSDLEISKKMGIENKRFHSKKHNLIQKIQKEYKKLGIIVSLMIIIFVANKSLEEENIIYKGNINSKELEIPDIKEQNSSCTDKEQTKAKKFLEISYNIDNESSDEYLNSLIKSLTHCYSPEVATKVNIIKAQRENNPKKKIEFLKDALENSSSSLHMKYRLEKEIYILNLLKEYYDGVDKKDIENKINIKTKELNEIKKNG
jgi:RNA polymerase sigma-70 factor (ECF subfamily)